MKLLNCYHQVGDRWNEGRGSAAGRGEEFVKKTEEPVEEEEGACGPHCRSVDRLNKEVFLGYFHIFSGSFVKRCL